MLNCLVHHHYSFISVHRLVSASDEMVGFKALVGNLLRKFFNLNFSHDLFIQCLRQRYQLAHSVCMVRFPFGRIFPKNECVSCDGMLHNNILKINVRHRLLSIFVF